jgi:hypothetical protein
MMEAGQAARLPRPSPLGFNPPETAGFSWDALPNQTEEKRKGLMSRLMLALGAAPFALVLGLSIAAHAGIAEPAAGHKVPMHPSALTLKSGSHGKQRARHHNYVHDTFHQPTPVHGTTAGPRM